MTFTTIYDEKDSTTFSKTYLVKYTSTTPYYIRVNASAVPPYPGVRWVSISMTANAKTSNSYLPIIIYPEIMPLAQTTKPEP